MLFRFFAWLASLFEPKTKAWQKPPNPKPMIAAADTAIATSASSRNADSKRRIEAITKETDDEAIAKMKARNDLAEGKK